MMKLIIFLMVFVSFPALSEVVKCKNAQGKVIYSDGGCPSSAKPVGKVDFLDEKTDAEVSVERARARNLVKYANDLRARDSAELEQRNIDASQAELQKNADESAKLAKKEKCARDKRVVENLKTAAVSSNPYSVSAAEDAEKQYLRECNTR